jgi:hypothetical protein
VTESLDGRPVAPLMGDYRDYDIGTLRVRTVPNFWCHASVMSFVDWYLERKRSHDPRPPRSDPHRTPEEGGVR